MKLLRNCANKLVAGSVALFVLAWAAELSAAPGKQGSGQGSATVSGVKGATRYSTDNGRTWHPVKVGLILKAPALIQTAANSHVDLVLGEREVTGHEPTIGNLVFTPGTGEDANVLRITPDSILSIDKLMVEETGADVVSDTQLDLRAGRIMGNVKKLSAASRYEVKFPTGVAGIRGTIYTIDKNGLTRVLTGSVVVSYLKDGVVQTQVVMAGYQFDPATGLVTPIPEFDKKEMVREFRELGGKPNVPPTTFTVDNTIYYVSPTTGHNGVGIGPPPGGVGKAN